MTFTSGEYGVISAKQEHLRTQGDYDVTQSKDQKNVPLTINQRRSNDYLQSQKDNTNQQNTPIIKGATGIASGQLQPGVNTQHNSFQQMPKNIVDNHIFADNKMVSSSS